MIGLKDVIANARKLNIDNIAGLVKGDIGVIKTTIIRKVHSIKDPTLRRRITSYFNNVDSIIADSLNSINNNGNFHNSVKELKLSLVKIKKEINNDAAKDIHNLRKKIKEKGIMLTKNTNVSESAHVHLEQIKSTGLSDFFLSNAKLESNKESMHVKEDFGEETHDHETIGTYTINAIFDELVSFVSRIVNFIWNLITYNIWITLFTISGTIILGLLYANGPTIAALVYSFKAIFALLTTIVRIAIFLGVLVPTIGMGLLELREISRNRFDIFIYNLKRAYNDLNNSVELHHIIAALVKVISVFAIILIALISFWPAITHFIGPAILVSKYMKTAVFISILSIIAAFCIIMASISTKLYLNMAKIYGKNYFSLIISNAYDLLSDLAKAVVSIFKKADKVEYQTHDVEETSAAISDDAERVEAYFRGKLNSSIYNGIINKISQIPNNVSTIVNNYRTYKHAVSNFSMM